MFFNLDINLSIYRYIYIYILELRPREARPENSSIYIYIYKQRQNCPDKNINIAIYRYIDIYIYIYRDGPRGVIWNLVVRASFKNVFFTMNSESHEFWTILSASILTFSCGSNGMGPDIQFSAICEVRARFRFSKRRVFQK